MCVILGIITALAGNETLGGHGSSLYFLKLGQWFNASGPF